MRTVGVVLFPALAMILSSRPAAQAGEACYAHQFLGDKPDEENPGWHQEAQGLAHDTNYWYAVQNVPACVVPPDHDLCELPTPQGCVVPSIVCFGLPQTCESVRPGKLWKIHVTHDLSDEGASFIATVSKEICDEGFDHVGDPTHYVHEGTGFILVPLEGMGPAVAAFRADTMASLGWSPLDPGESGQSSASWVAVDRYGFLWSGSHNETHLNRYEVEWDVLRDTGALEVHFLDHVPMLNEVGQPLALESYEQGGAFADDPGLPFPLLYLVNGDADNDCDCGVHVLEIRDAPTGEGCTTAQPCVATRVDRSANGSGAFSYAYDPGFSTYEEPEGVTFWDLDADPRAPGVSGQVHVVLLDNDEPLVGQGDDDVYVKHYRLETDSVAPVVECPPDVLVECTGNSGIQASDPQLGPFLTGASATDACDQDVTIGSDAPAFFPLGSTVVTFTATDDFGNSSSCSATVTVQDTTDPSITVQLEPGLLWSPNHQLVGITATVGVTDVCDPTPSFVLTSISSNEPDNGLGDGDTPGDIQGAQIGTPDVSFLLRAERSGTGTGRVYTAVFTASDDSGNTAQAADVVTVPHNP